LTSGLLFSRIGVKPIKAGVMANPRLTLPATISGI
jgi:hypothetical protein